MVTTPVYDALFNEQFSRLARNNGDELLALMADDFDLDAHWHRDFAKALVTYAVEHKPELRDQLEEWTQKWTPLAHQAAVGVSAFFGEAPQPSKAEEVAVTADERSKSFRAECGL